MPRTFKPLPSLEILNDLFEVVPIREFGVDSGLIWKVDRRGRAKAGSVAGTFYGKNPTQPDRKDWRVDINQKPFMVSRVVYKICTGIDPLNYEIDHIDRNFANNNIDNLRLVTDRSIQVHNRRKPKNNKTGVFGVSRTKYKNKPFIAHLSGVPNVSTHIGYFTCLLEAAYVYNARVCKYFPEHYDVKSNDLSKVRCTCGNCAKILNKAEVFGI